MGQGAFLPKRARVSICFKIVAICDREGALSVWDALRLE
jgi:hypothetical protein